MYIISFYNITLGITIKLISLIFLAFNMNISHFMSVNEKLNKNRSMPFQNKNVKSFNSVKNYSTFKKINK